MDFTISVFKRLLIALKSSGYTFQRFSDFGHTMPSKKIILRHDVDQLPNNALNIAKVENKLEIKASYYFRATNRVFVPDIITQIADLGHEIGYHYENMDTQNGDVQAAYQDFKQSISKFRRLYPVKTICMHGSPLSKWDNRDLWKKYDYKDFGIIAEPYFDIDFSDVLYLTDTGRRWDGRDVSVRDKVAGKGQNAFDSLKFRSTMDIINAAHNGLLPDRIMINTHPQRWGDRFVPWAKELVWQNIKNVVKKIIVRNR